MDERLPLLQTLPFSLQHQFAMFAFLAPVLAIDRLGIGNDTDQ